MTSSEIWEMISGSSAVTTDTLDAYGNYTSGLVLEEYYVHGQWVQIAINPNINDIVEWEITDEQDEAWLVG